jgi:hypothetical protein
VRCLASGIKISITGDLWSENGMGLFGIYAHGMPEFKMEKALIAAHRGFKIVPCLVCVPAPPVSFIAI